MAFFKASLSQFFVTPPLIWKNFVTSGRTEENAAAAIHIFYLPDPYHDFLIRNHWWSGENQFKSIKKSGRDLTVSWLEESYLMPSFFWQPVILEVYNAQEIQPGVLKFLMEIAAQKDFPGAVLWNLSSSNKQSKSKKTPSIEKTDLICQYEILAPKYYEIPGFIKFLAQHFNVNLNLEELNEVERKFADNWQGAFHFFRQFTLIGEDSLAKKEAWFQIEQNNNSSLNKFDLAISWGDKNWKEVLLLLTSNPNLSQDREALGFVRSHFLKFPDIWKNLAPKPENTYQRAVFSQAKNWSPEKWESEIKLISQMEIEVKKRNTQAVTLFIHQHLDILSGKARTN